NFKEINQASFILSRYGIVTSQEGEAAFAGIIKASKLCDFKEPLCLFTGHYSEWKDTELKEKKNIYKVETYREAKKLFDKMLGK
ncbi:MAG: hypothetical protein HY934_09885, partial [Candidatus Firestonebacteria bacterium]|nr:hypothetical protein [Candidatus Firestonebacteria bacterium]